MKSMVTSPGDFSQGITLASPTPTLPSSDTTLATLDSEQSVSFTAMTSDLLLHFSTLAIFILRRAQEPSAKNVGTSSIFQERTHTIPTQHCILICMKSICRSTTQCSTCRNRCNSYAPMKYLNFFFPTKQLFTQI